MDLQILSYSITAVVSLLMALKALNEYVKQGKQKRADLLEKYRTKFQNAEYAKLITHNIEEDKIELRQVSQQFRYYYIGFFEELGVLLNSGLLSQNTIFYFFGFYILKTYESKNFWNGINRNEDAIFWQEFFKLVKKMESTKKMMKKNNSDNYKSIKL